MAAGRALARTRICSARPHPAPTLSLPRKSRNHHETYGKALFCASLLLGSTGHASLVTFETAFSSAGPQAIALAYRTVVDQALAVPGARFARLAAFNNASNHTVFGGSFQNIAFRMTMQFDVSAADAGIWAFRAGVDFGNGGAVFLDGVATDFNPNDMWWGGSYAIPGQSFQFSSVSLSEGTHTLQIYGLENCCDGGQQAQFSINARQYTTFGGNDGLAPTVVPEPQAGSVMIFGLAVLSYITRQRMRSTSAKYRCRAVTSAWSSRSVEQGLSSYQGWLAWFVKQGWWCRSNSSTTQRLDV